MILVSPLRPFPAALLALARLVLVQVRGLTRQARQLATDPQEPAGGRWEFADCALPPGWLLPPVRCCGERELLAAVTPPASCEARVLPEGLIVRGPRS